MYVVATLDIEQLKKIGWPFYWAMILLTFALFIAPESIARTVNEAKRWYQIPVLGSFQPSEFLKFALLIVVSKVIVAHREKYVRPTFLTDMRLLLIIAVLTLPPILAVYKQPDTGMVMLYMSMIVPMLFFSGIQRKLLIIFTAIPVSILSVLAILYVKFNEFFTDKI